MANDRKWFQPYFSEWLVRKAFDNGWWLVFPLGLAVLVVILR